MPTTLPAPTSAAGAPSGSWRDRLAVLPAALDRRDVVGPLAVVGDVHGSRVQLEKLLARLDEQVPGATIVFVGDLPDRGDDTPGCYRVAGELVADGRALLVSSNHGDALVRKAGPLLAAGLAADEVALELFDRYDRALAAGTRQVATRLTAEAVAQFADLPDGTERLAAAVELERTSPHQLLLDGGRLVVVHGGIRVDLLGATGGEAVAVANFGTPSGTDDRGRPVGRDSWRVAWADAREREPDLPYVVYGHVAYRRPFLGPHAAGIDTGAGKLRQAPVTAAVWADGRVVDLVAAHA